MIILLITVSNAEHLFVATYETLMGQLALARLMRFNRTNNYNNNQISDSRFCRFSLWLFRFHFFHIQIGFLRSVFIFCFNIVLLCALAVSPWSDMRVSVCSLCVRLIEYLETKTNGKQRKNTTIILIGIVQKFTARLNT